MPPLDFITKTLRKNRGTIKSISTIVSTAEVGGSGSPIVRIEPPTTKPAKTIKYSANTIF